MSIRISIAVAMLAVSVKTAVADDHSMTTGFALSDSGKTLTVIADLAEPQNTFKSNLSAKLDALAWRPVTSELLGFSRGTIYKVDPTSGALTDLNAAFMDDAKISKEAMVAFDFVTAHPLCKRLKSNMRFDRACFVAIVFRLLLGATI